MNIYSSSVISISASVHIHNIGGDIREVLTKYVRFHLEGKCSKDGYIKPGSVNVLSHSSGVITAGVHILFTVVFECLVCFPVDGMRIRCTAVNITKAGIRAEITDDVSADGSPVASPLVIFVARDHYYNDAQFSEVAEGDSIEVLVIGQRYELNDAYISVIGRLATLDADAPETIRDNK